MAATTVLRPFPFPASRARFAMPRSSVSSVFQVVSPGIAGASATPVNSDSAKGAETRQVRTMVAGVESRATPTGALDAGVERVRRPHYEVGEPRPPAPR